MMYTGIDQPYVGICLVHRVNPVASMRAISWLMEATWWINLKSSTEKYCGEGVGYMFKLGKGNITVRCHCSIVASISDVHMRSGLSGVVDRSSATVMSL